MMQTDQPTPVAMGLAKGRSPWVSALNQGMTRITWLLSLVGAVSLLIAVGLTMCDIALRSVSTNTVKGVVDLSQLFILIGAMFAVPYDFMTDQHVAIDLFVDKLSYRTRVGLRIFSSLLGTVFLCMVFWFSYLQAMVEYSGGDRSQSIGIPMIWYWAPFLFGLLLSIVATLVVSLDLIRNGLPQHAIREIVQ